MVPQPQRFTRTYLLGFNHKNPAVWGGQMDLARLGLSLFGYIEARKFLQV
jgi:hypothetical protein